MVFHDKERLNWAKLYFWGLNMGRRRITRSELDEHMNRRDVLFFDYLVDEPNAVFTEDLEDTITDVVEKQGVLYAVGREVQHPESKFSYSPWYEVLRIFPHRRKNEKTAARDS